MYYANQEISYHYQVWRIRDKSVCADQKNDVVKYSRCTVAAKSLFEKMCKELTNQKGIEKDWRYQKSKNMYCNAATTFKPTIAQISVPSAMSKENEELRVQCNRLIAKAMGSDEPAIIDQRNRVCGEYEKKR